MAREAVQYITLLKMAEIPMEFWNDEAMNWYWFGGDRDPEMITLPYSTVTGFRLSR